MHYKRVLTIAGSDSSGGAGIQADIKTISACGGYALSAITAITAQNTLRIMEILPLPVRTIESQIDAVLSDIGADAIKIGMLPSPEIVQCVGRKLDQYKIRNIVLDPVMVSTSGQLLMNKEATRILKEELLDKVRIITPNIPEAEYLLGTTIRSQKEMPQIARELSFGRTVSVFLKAGHCDRNTLVDIFYNSETDEIIELSAERILTNNTHGTGCTLSSAMATFLASGDSLNAAAQKARAYVYQAILAGSVYTIGRGNGPLHHFYSW